MWIDLIRLRRWHGVRLDDLTRLRAPVKRMMPFIIVADFTPHALERRGSMRLHPATPGAAGALSYTSCSVERRNVDKHTVEQITFSPTFAGWQVAARRALGARTAAG